MFYRQSKWPVAVIICIHSNIGKIISLITKIKLHNIRTVLGKVKNINIIHEKIKKSYVVGNWISGQKDRHSNSCVKSVTKPSKLWFYSYTE